jgi:GNAT superfamily N-acetyltransferase
MTVIRALLPEEARRYTDHLLRLTAEDRRSRFMAMADDGRIERHVASINWNQTLVLAAIDQGEVHAAGELSWGADRRAELAVSVEKGWQGHGLGGNLTRRLVLAARNRGLRKLGMSCMPDNRRMQSITRKYVGPYVMGGGEVTSLVDLPPASPVTVLHEIIDRFRVPLDLLLDTFLPAPGATAREA